HHPAGRPGMNPAKAAPSASVKKATREDPQILPGGLLILFFFFYLRWVRQKTHKGIANNLA
ncbi:hypothetical protein, partial [Gemmiger sp.]|uniref:hypothetical protein n=1 Tax=Gemmiger sp. TaxID=2049027 RepID=UPI0025B93228